MEAEDSHNRSRPRGPRAANSSENAGRRSVGQGVPFLTEPRRKGPRTRSAKTAATRSRAIESPVYGTSRVGFNFHRWRTLGRCARDRREVPVLRLVRADRSYGLAHVPHRRRLARDAGGKTGACVSATALADHVRDSWHPGPTPNPDSGVRERHSAGARNPRNFRSDRPPEGGAVLRCRIGPASSRCLLRSPVRCLGDWNRGSRKRS